MLRTHRAPIRAALFVACAAISAPALANGIRIADQPALAPLTSLQAAIDAAPDGGLLLVQSGTYGAAVVDGKSLSIVEMPGADARTNGTLTIRNLTSTQRVLVSGFQVTVANGPAVVLANDVGTVRLQGCKLTGGRIPLGGGTHAGAAGVRAESSREVVIAGCELIGGNALVEFFQAGTPGGAGLDALDSNIALFDCTLRGGRGAELGNPGGDGGDACRLSGWGMFASGCTFVGGTCGFGDFVGCAANGAGGSSLRITAAQALLLDATLTPGSGGGDGCGFTPTSPAMAIVNNGGVVNSIAGTRRKLVAGVLAADDGLLTVTVTGQPGDSFHLQRSPTTWFAYQSQWHGLWTIPPLAGGVLRVIIPPSGTITAQVQSRDLVGGAGHRLEILQGICFDTAGQRWLTGPAHVEVLDAARGPDCDGIAGNDFVQLLNGAADCNRNVTPDPCDISAGTSQDANQNGIPDECSGG
jgi:hypothetical protein